MLHLLQEEIHPLLKMCAVFRHFLEDILDTDLATT